MHNTKHKWYDVIVAWASGEKIQVKSTKGNDTFEDYIDYDGVTPDFASKFWEWRIKPKTVTKRYRMALVEDVPFDTVVALDLAEYSLDFPAEREVAGFIRWVGDAVEVEVEV